MLGSVSGEGEGGCTGTERERMTGVEWRMGKEREKGWVHVMYSYNHPRGRE